MSSRKTPSPSRQKFITAGERRIILYKGAEPPGAFIRGVGWGGWRWLERFHQNDFSLPEQEENRQNKKVSFSSELVPLRENSVKNKDNEDTNTLTADTTGATPTAY